MYDLRRCFLTLSTACGCALGWAAPARAWVETRIESHVATVDVDAQGAALVTCDLSLAVRGGPLAAFEMDGVDLDAVPLPEASVTPRSSRSEPKPIPLLVNRRDDGTLRLEIDRERGLRTGNYLFHFQYRTNLLARGLIHRAGQFADVRWVGPRFSQGVDSARVLFRLPAASPPPALPNADESAGHFSEGDALGGVFIANLERLGDKDQLEIVRPHVARGEPVVWMLRASATAFPALEPEARAAPAPKTTVVSPPAADERRRRFWLFLTLGALAAGYAILINAKWACFRAACARRGAQPCALLARLPGLRAALCGLLLALGAALAAWWDEPLFGALALTLGVVLAAQRARPLPAAPRAPGEWLPLSEREAFALERSRLPEALLDGSTRLGRLTCLALLGALGCGAALLRQRAPYLALLVPLGGVALLPIFFTGCSRDLPPDRAVTPRRFLRRLARRLGARAWLKVLPWGRVPDKSPQFDELRLLIKPADARRGLVGIEVGVEYAPSLFGALGSPFVLVRVRDGSDAARALPAEARWTRGRRPDERVALLRPNLPFERACRRLVLRLADQLSEPRPSSSSSRPSSSGSASSTAKALKVESPAHAM